MSSPSIENQGVLQERPLLELISESRGVLEPKHLAFPYFDPEQVMTMAEYIGEIGARMADTPRESRTKDSALGIYGRDFRQAEPANLGRGLFFPPIPRGVRPRKLVARVGGWSSEGVAVSEELYEAIVFNAPYFSNKIANRTEKANGDDPVIEQVEDLGGESVLYALTDKHELLEAHDQELLSERAKLIAVWRSLSSDQPEQARRIKHLEPYRLAALTAIQSMVYVASKSLGYGTNQTRNTMLAVISDTHRAADARLRFRGLCRLAIRHNDAVRGKVTQSIHAIGAEISIHAEHAINNIDREYTD